MSFVPPALSVPAAQLAQRIEAMLAGEPPGAVAHRLRAGGQRPVTARELATYGELVADALDRPLFRLATADLAAPPPRRVAALLALVDATDVARAVLLVDAADTLVPDPAATAAVRARLGEWDGGVVLLVGGSGEGGPLVAELAGEVTVLRVA